MPQVIVQETILGHADKWYMDKLESMLENEILGYKQITKSRQENQA